MKVIHAANELKAKGKKVCLAIGFFDGVHLGHQQIIRQTIADARQHEALALVVTFDQHPSTIVAPGRVPPLIYSLPQRLRAIDSLGSKPIPVEAVKNRLRKAAEGYSGEEWDWADMTSGFAGAGFEVNGGLNDITTSDGTER